jgi:hypothetical protein
LEVDLKITGWLYLGYKASIEAREIELDNVADLGTKFMDFFHGLGDI